MRHSNTPEIPDLFDDRWMFPMNNKIFTPDFNVYRSKD